MHSRLYTWAMLLLLAFSTAATASDRMLLLQPGETLSACQTFYWTARNDASRYSVAIGSCSGCTDIANRDTGINLSTSFVLPADGRTLYVTLSTEVGGAWEREEHIYRAPAENLPQSCPASPETSVGIYHWSGQASRSMSQGVMAIAGLGVPLLRLTLSPRLHRDYNIDDKCPGDFNLANFLRDPDVRQALSNSAIRTFMLTCSMASVLGIAPLRPFSARSSTTPITGRGLCRSTRTLRSNCTGLTMGRARPLSCPIGNRTTRSTAAVRINMPGSAEFRAQCDQTYTALYSGNAGPAESLSALREWFTARW